MFLGFNPFSRSSKPVVLPPAAPQPARATMKPVPMVPVMPVEDPVKKAQEEQAARVAEITKEIVAFEEQLISHDKLKGIAPGSAEDSFHTAAQADKQWQSLTNSQKAVYHFPKLKALLCRVNADNIKQYVDTVALAKSQAEELEAVTQERQEIVNKLVDKTLALVETKGEMNYVLSVLKKCAKLTSTSKALADAVTKYEELLGWSITGEYGIASRVKRSGVNVLFNNSDYLDRVVMAGHSKNDLEKCVDDVKTSANELSNHLYTAFTPTFSFNPRPHSNMQEKKYFEGIKEGYNATLHGSLRKVAEELHLPRASISNISIGMWKDDSIVKLGSLLVIAETVQKTFEGIALRMLEAEKQNSSLQIGKAEQLTAIRHLAMA